MTEVNHDPGPTTTQSASAIATRASGQAGGSAGSSATSTTCPSVVATSAWPRISVIASGCSGSSPSTRAVMSSGTADIGSTRPLRAEQPGHPVEPVDGLAEQLPQRDDQQVADRVVVQLTVAAEAVLQHVGPGPAPLVVAAQRGQRHPQITRRQYAELAGAAARTNRRCRRR